MGYGARYYSYLLARSVASNIWQKFFKNNPYDSDKGGEYRKNCLSHGGAKPSPKIIEDLLGHSVDPVQLSDALLQEIDEKQELIAKLFKWNIYFGVFWKIWLLSETHIITTKSVNKNVNKRNDGKKRKKPKKGKKEKS